MKKKLELNINKINSTFSNNKISNNTPQNNTNTKVIHKDEIKSKFIPNSTKHNKKSSCHNITDNTYLNTCSNSNNINFNNSNINNNQSLLFNNTQNNIISTFVKKEKFLNTNKTNNNNNHNINNNSNSSKRISIHLFENKDGSSNNNNNSTNNNTNILINNNNTNIPNNNTKSKKINETVSCNSNIHSNLVNDKNSNLIKDNKELKDTKDTKDTKDIRDQGKDKSKTTKNQFTNLFISMYNNQCKANQSNNISNNYSQNININKANNNSIEHLDSLVNVDNTNTTNNNFSINNSVDVRKTGLNNNLTNNNVNFNNQEINNQNSSKKENLNTLRKLVLSTQKQISLTEKQLKFNSNITDIQEIIKFEGRNEKKKNYKTFKQSQKNDEGRIELNFTNMESFKSDKNVQKFPNNQHLKQNKINNSKDNVKASKDLKDLVVNVNNNNNHNNQIHQNPNNHNSNIYNSKVLKLTKDKLTGTISQVLNEFYKSNKVNTPTSNKKNLKPNTNIEKNPYYQYTLNSQIINQNTNNTNYNSSIHRMHNSENNFNDGKVNSERNYNKQKIMNAFNNANIFSTTNDDNDMNKLSSFVRSQNKVNSNIINNKDGIIDKLASINDNDNINKEKVKNQITNSVFSNCSYINTNEKINEKYHHRNKNSKTKQIYNDNTNTNSQISNLLNYKQIGAIKEVIKNTLNNESNKYMKSQTRNKLKLLEKNKENINTNQINQFNTAKNNNRDNLTVKNETEDNDNKIFETNFEINKLNGTNTGPINVSNNININISINNNQNQSHNNDSNKLLDNNHKLKRESFVDNKFNKKSYNDYEKYEKSDLFKNDSYDNKYDMIFNLLHNNLKEITEIVCNETSFSGGNLSIKNSTTNDVYNCSKLKIQTDPENSVKKSDSNKFNTQNHNTINFSSNALDQELLAGLKHSSINVSQEIGAVLGKSVLNNLFKDDNNNWSYSSFKSLRQLGLGLDKNDNLEDNLNLLRNSFNNLNLKNTLKSNDKTKGVYKTITHINNQGIKNLQSPNGENSSITDKQLKINLFIDKKLSSNKILPIPKNENCCISPIKMEHQDISNKNSSETDNSDKFVKKTAEDEEFDKMITRKVMTDIELNEEEKLEIIEKREEQCIIF